MRAQFVFEKFKEASDPIKDMDIGYKKKQLDSKSWKILEFIKSKGDQGASLTEIQYYIWTELDGHDEKGFWRKTSYSAYNSKTKKFRDVMSRATRGHWNTQLFGGPYYHKGLLHKYCEKNPKTKKWVLKRMPKPKELIYDWPKDRY